MKEGANDSNGNWLPVGPDASWWGHDELGELSDEERCLMYRHGSEPFSWI